jgi:hypothetical protein
MCVNQYLVVFNTKPMHFIFYTMRPAKHRVKGDALNHGRVGDNMLAGLACLRYQYGALVMLDGGEHLKYLYRNQVKCHFIHHKSDVDGSGIEPEPTW